MEVLDNYLSFVPSELLDIISLYLNYTESVILLKFSGKTINYEYLLREKYPAF